MSLRLVVFTLLTITATAEIRRGRYTLLDGSVARLDEFGYTRNGHLNLTISHFSLAPQPLCDPNGTAQSKLGFFLCTFGFFKGIDGGACPLQSPSVFPVLTIDPVAPGSSHSVLYNITSRPTEQYSLVFANCLPYVRVSMDYRVEAYNVAKNGERDYLPIGKAPLPTAYLLFSTAYIFLYAVWIMVFRKNGKRLERIHSLMIFTAALKGFKLMFEAGSLISIEGTGTGFGYGWGVLWFIFGFFEGAAFFAMIALIGAGWSSLKPSLEEDDVMVLMLVIPLQIPVSLGQATEACSPTFDLVWWMFKLLVWCPDFVCCFLVSLPIVWSVRNLRERPNSMKMALFRRYGYAVATYVFLSKVVVFAMEFVAWYEYWWMRFLVGELESFGFCVFIGFLLRPHSNNAYFAAMDDEEEVKKEEEEASVVEQSKLEDEFEIL